MALSEKPQNGYTGVNLRTSRTNLKDEHAARAINVDFNREVGTASIRYGMTQQADLADNVVRLIAKVNSKRYYAAGNTLYRDGTSIAAGIFPAQLFGDTLPSGLTDIEGFRPLNDSAIWAFVADLGNRAAIDLAPQTQFKGRGHSAMVKDNGTTTYKWGIAPPPLKPVAPEVLFGTVNESSPSLSGDHTWYVTHIRFDTYPVVAHEGNPIALDKNTPGSEFADIT